MNYLNSGTLYEEKWYEADRDDGTDEAKRQAQDTMKIDNHIYHGDRIQKTQE